jgi:Scaffold protein Nfu/NifU N terminal
VVVVIPEATPNPNAIKFTLDRAAVASGSATFADGSDAAANPLGAAVFALGGVTNVFMVANFVSVTKSADASWDDIAPGVVGAIEAHFSG